ncbi:hypothetical protein DFJ73DRAFT_879244 [Zopfochytrium polystomum]|nr:hypothetical protein DFJ73DRAFT_879244 [Zopfochytrium polystomum]
MAPHTSATSASHLLRTASLQRSQLFRRFCSYWSQRTFSRLLSTPTSHQSTSQTLPTPSPISSSAMPTLQTARRYCSSQPGYRNCSELSAFHTQSSTTLLAVSQPSRPPGMYSYRVVLRVESRRHATNFISEFYKSVQRQVEENREFQQNVKLLSEKTTEIAESDSMKRAKEAMAKGAQGTSKVVEGISHVAGKVGEGVGQVLESAPVKKTVEVVGKVGETVQKVAVDPLLETQTAKTIASGIESIQKDLSTNASARYLEHADREAREAEKQARAEAAAKAIKPNAEATAVATVAEQPAEPASIASWTRSVLAKTPLGAKVADLGRAIDESENPVVERVRDTWYRISSALTDETEEARVIRTIREVEPRFERERFLAEATRFIIPEILEAHLKGDLSTLKDWCSEKVYAELAAGVQLQKTAGLVSDCKLLDLSRVDIKSMKFLEDRQIPYLHMTFNTQEVLLFRDRKTGEIKLGAEDQIDAPVYNLFVTKSQFVDESAAPNPVTNGWKVIAWVRTAGGW